VAEIIVCSGSSTKQCLRAVIDNGRPIITDVGIAEHDFLPDFLIRGYDAANDIIYALPDSARIDLSQLSWELDLHIPEMLSLQTDMHWFASSIAGYVLIQPISQHGSSGSPLLACKAIASTLNAGSILLQCDAQSIMAVEVGKENLIVQTAGIGIEAFAGMQDSSRDRVLQLRKNSHVILSGSDVNASVLHDLNAWRPHSFELISEKHLMASADIEHAASEVIRVSPWDYALMVGSLAVLSGSHEALICVH
jgi:hypothetical protein